MICRVKAYCLIFFFLFIFCLSISHASEFLISAPDPEDYKHLDVTFSEESMHTSPYNFLSFPSVEFYYGIIPNLDIELLLTYAFYLPQDTPGAVNANGIGDTFLSSTFRFLKESKYLPELAIEPSYLIPTGSYNAGLGNGAPLLSLPLSAQKKWKSFDVIVNVGYTYNWAPFTENYFYEGIRFDYNPNDKLSLGIELYNQGATALNTSASGDFLLAVGQYLLLNVGADYQLTKSLSLQASAGKNVSGANIIVTFLGLDYHM